MAEYIVLFEPAPQKGEVIQYISFADMKPARALSRIRMDKIIDDLALTGSRPSYENKYRKMVHIFQAGSCTRSFTRKAMTIATGTPRKPIAVII